MATMALMRSQPMAIGRQWLRLLLLTALIVGSVTTRAFAASPKEIQEMDDRLKYEGENYDNQRKITYLGQIRLSIYDYVFDGYSEKDAEFLKLIVKIKSSSMFPSYRPRDDINAHFMAEVRRFFKNLPFHDLSDGRRQRLDQFTRDNPQWDYAKPSVDVGHSFDAFNAAELARQKALYGGRAGTVNCDVRVKRRAFPILYEIGCTVSAEEGFVPTWSETRDIGFSTPEHIDKEIKQALTRMLEKKSIQHNKIIKYGKK